MKLKLDSGFFGFLKSQKNIKVAALLLAGVLLIFLGTLGGARSGGGDNAQSSSAQGTEERVGYMCSLADGVGRCEVMLTYSQSGEVESALVLCEGADSASVRSRVVSMVSTLFGIGTNRIEVVKISE